MNQRGSSVRLLAGIALLSTALAACGGHGSSSSAPAAATAASSASAAAVGASSSSGGVNPAKIPLGDGHVSTAPKRGYVDSCVTSFPSTGGAQADGPWINVTAKTWDSLTKTHVQGAVTWPQAKYSITVTRTRRIIRTNDLPRNHTTGVFPVAASDPAYRYDANPNTITAQSVRWSLPRQPKAARKPTCTPLGPVGVLDDGVLLFNALDGEGRDAGAHEVLDACGEHPQMGGLLHHHTVPSCILKHATGRSTLVGYAIDGYGIYVERTTKGALLTNADLDACHGRTSTVRFDGRRQRIYHYDATIEYPYTVGCFHATPISTGITG